MLPTITINFFQRAMDVVSKSAAGKMAVVLKKDEGKATGEASETSATYTFHSAAEVEASTDLNAVHKDICKMAFYRDGAPKEMIVDIVEAAASASDTTTLDAIKDLAFSWVVPCTGDATLSKAVQASVIAFNADSTNARKIKCLVINSQITTPDEHIAGIATCSVAFNNGHSAITTSTFWHFLGRVGALLVSTPITESITYKVLPEVREIKNPSSDTGNVIKLVQSDGAVRMSKGIASNGTNIAIVEAKDIIAEDIILTFRNYYLGKKRNTQGNQLSFCASVLGYFKELQSQGVINPDEDIVCEQDIDAMREAHPTYYDNKDNNWVAAHPYGTEVYVRTSLYLMDVMEDCVFSIYLN